jgi:hypothetical protein
MKRILTLLISFLIITGLLAGPSALQAKHKPSHVKGSGGAKKSGGHKGRATKGRTPGYQIVRTPWAKTKGYTLKYKYKADKDAPVLVFLPTALLSASMSGIGRCNRGVIAAVLGAVAGGPTDSDLIDGENNVIADIGGRALGKLTSGTIAEAMDEPDNACVGQILEHIPSGFAIAWHDTDHGADYNMIASRTYKSDSGQDCREYNISTILGGKVETDEGAACRMSDGSWKKTN